MKKIEAVIQPSELYHVKKALNSIGIQAMTLSDVRGLGCQEAHKEICRETEYVALSESKIKIEMIVPTEMVDQVVETVISAASTGHDGDGKIFVLPVETVVRIRTGERDKDALAASESRHNRIPRSGSNCGFQAHP